MRYLVSIPVLCLLLAAATPAPAFILNLGAEEIVAEAAGEIVVDAYSVPSLVDWNADGLPDLLVGEGGGLVAGRVRVYVNVGAVGAPAFDGYTRVLADGVELTVPGNG